MAQMVLRCMPRHEGHEETARLPDTDPPLTPEAELRAGHPGLCFMPPFYPPAPQRSAGGST